MKTHPLDHLNSDYLQLGLFALLFGGLQIWWIGSTLRKRDLARPLSEVEFRKSLEQVWARGKAPGSGATVALLPTHGGVTEVHRLTTVIERSWTGPLFYGYGRCRA